MKRFRFILLLILLVIVLRGWLYRLTVSYHPIGERPAILATDKGFIQHLEHQPIDTSMQRIVRQSLNLTTSQLEFSFGKCDSDPNRLFYSQKANCVGYAAYFNAVCHQLIERAGLEKRYRVQHLRAKITFLGFDLHQLSNSPFFKDHDYNMVEDLQTGERFFVDASTKDVLGIGFVKSE
ncbi:MAG: hypothetical protein IPN76_21810 [Saprospiraceae bacterium]|nr:hypothetical protein [Saprospiraceae bacterium]